MQAQRALTIMLFVVAMSFAVRAIAPDAAHGQPSIIIVATPTLLGPALAFAAEHPAEQPTPTGMQPTSMPPATSEPAAAAPPAPPAEAPPAPPAAPAEAAPAEAPPSFYPDPALVDAAMQSYADLPSIQCPCGVIAEEPYQTMTAQQQRQSRQRTR